MKNHRTFFAVLLILIVGLAWWWFATTNQATVASKAHLSKEAKNPVTNSSPVVASSSNQPPGAPPPPPAYGAPPVSAAVSAARDPFASASPAAMAALQKAVSSDDSKDAIMQAAWAAANSETLTLYGKVIDQNGNPVVGANVRGGTMLIGGVERSGGAPFQVQTDGEGRFNVSAHGTDIGVTFQKEGYEYDQKLSAQRPEGYFKSSPDHPVVFSMWKTNGAEPMVHAKFGDWIPYDGTSVSIDLFTGKKSDTGDLRVTLLRNPVQVKRGQEHFDWDVKIEITGGGLTETHDVYPFEAPGNGYQAIFEFSQSKDDPQWTRKLTQTFYVHTPNGDYGRINIDLTTDSDKPAGTGLGVEAWMNPSGSRDLEFDSTKQVKPQ